MQERLVEFIRKRDYRFVKELGQGACGKTVLLRDDMIDELFVCKKYSPYSEGRREELFSNFVREVKLLHKVNHNNVIRVFNYYLYPDLLTGYILMEYIQGTDIEDYLRDNPERTSDVFLQVIDGFRYLETHNILHRDIRPQNLMVREDGTVKIIDLGFGKQIELPEDFDKSISLNLWCERPQEFDDSIYDFCSEVYFVGKLFEKIIQENGIDHFEYEETLGRMCQHNPVNRTQSFLDIEKEVQNKRFPEIDFSDNEKLCYREFASCLQGHITKVENGAKYIDDVDRVLTALEEVYRTIMLEQTALDAAPILRCFLSGSYYYRKAGFPVPAVRDFLRLLKSCTQEKSRIIMANLHTRLDSLQRYEEDSDSFEDDIPF